jgi:hypothetical protein
MAEKPENLLLEYMRRFDARQARFEDALRDVSARLSSIKGYLATMHGDLARHGFEIETINSRLDRIERRLDLADAPAQKESRPVSPVGSTRLYLCC